MRKFFMFLLLLMFSVVFMSTNATAYPVPADGLSYEMDISGYSGLFRNEQMVETGALPQVGDESRAVIRVSDIYSLDEDWGGIRKDNVFTSSNDDKNLFVIEKGLFIDYIYYEDPDNPSNGEISIFFNSVDNDGTSYNDYQFEAYLDSDLEWATDVRDNPDWNTLYPSIATNDLLWAGWFTQSTYEGAWGTRDALVGITLDPGLESGRWIENDEIPISNPAGDFINPQSWVNLDPAYAYPWIENLWGPGKDLAIGAVNLDSASSRGWTTHANDWTRGATVPEPTTWLLFGTGLLGLAALGRKRLKKQE